ncbi:MAG: type II secretion system F family protein [Candidatus Komeilibacteria bacterium]
MLFTYVVTNKEGKVKKGEIEAPDKANALIELKKQDFLIVRVDKKQKRQAKEIAIGGVKFIDKVLVARHLAIMIKSGVSMAEALDILVDQSNNPKLKKILKDVHSSVLSGHTLSSSLAKHKKVFSELFINMVKIGETSGTLAETLDYLAQELEKSYAMKKKIKAASIYPSIVLVMTLGLAFVLVYFILPKMMKLFETLTVELPASTKLLIGIANAAQNHGLLMLLIMVSTVVIMTYLLRQEYVKKYSHKLILMTPVFGHISQQLNLANFNRTLGTLLKSGVQVTEALNITSGILNNRVYRAEVLRISDEVTRGLSLSEALSAKSDKLFPKMSTRLLQVGEKTGELENSLIYLGDFYGKEVDNITKNLSNVLEPMLLIFMGLMVGFVAIAIIQPVYQISGGLRK